MKHPIKSLNRHALTGAGVFLLALMPAAGHAADTPEPGINYFAKASVQIRSDFWQTGDDSARQHDTYVRRARVAGGWSYDGFSAFLELAADNTDRAPNNRVTDIPSLDDGNGGSRLSEAFVQYAKDEWKVRFGKSKLPLTRVYLVSSSEQLFWDRPIYTEYLRGFFRRFVDSNIQGQYFDKDQRFAGYLALSDGWNSGDEIYTGVKVKSSSPMVAARVEFSPFWGLEKKKTDGNATAKAASISAYVARQNNIKTALFTEERRVQGLDFLLRPEGIGSLSGEVNRWKTEGGPEQSQGRGWYVQAAMAGLPVEPVARYEKLKLENNVTGNTNLTSVSLGLNYYIKGHDLKVGANIQRNSGSAITNTLYPETLITFGIQAALGVKGSK